MRRYLSVFARLLSPDMKRISTESKEYLSFIKKDLFNKVPSISTLAGVTVGAYVSSSFASSPVRDALSALGVIDGGQTVVSPLAYKILSIFLPLFAAATAVYMVQKWLKAIRKKKIGRHIRATASLDEESQKELALKLCVLEQAREKGLLSASEHEAKLAALYQAYTKPLLPPVLDELIVKKLTS